MFSVKSLTGDLWENTALWNNHNKIFLELSSNQHPTIYQATRFLTMATHWNLLGTFWKIPVPRSLLTSHIRTSGGRAQALWVF